MNLQFRRKIPIPKKLIEELPITKCIKEIKQKRDYEIAKVFTRESNKFLLIIGPCSADKEKTVLDYISRLARVQEKVAEKIVIIPRVFTNKPRTLCDGYMGMLYQPNPYKEEDIFEGIIAVRKLHLKVITETGLTTADEMLYPEYHSYISDIISYVTVGARTVENQMHRLTASGLNIPVGFKNPMSGDINIMLNSIHAAQQKHTFLYRGWEVTSEGNLLSHAILRGYIDQAGENCPNYNYHNLLKLYDLYSARNLQNMTVIIDANHSNSNKNPMEQPRIAHEVMEYMKNSKDINDMVRGMMIESYIQDGNQSLYGKQYGKSITDPCLGWEKTERLIYELADCL